MKKEKKVMIAVSTRLEESVHEKLVVLAEKNTRSLNGQINALIKEADIDE